MSTRVLIVDDAKFIRHMIKNILVDLGCEVVGEAANGDEAFEKFKELTPDVVTMDIVMPKSSGIDALKKIRGENPEAKVVMISAIDQREPLMEALKLGARLLTVGLWLDSAVEPPIRKITEAAIRGGYRSTVTTVYERFREVTGLRLDWVEQL